MQIGVLTVHMALQGVTSLKQKRSIVKGVIGRLKSRFNVSIAEVDHQDSKISGTLGIAIVANDSRFLDQQLDTVLTFIHNDGRFYVSHIEREVFNP